MKVLVTGENSYAGRQFAKRIIELNKGWEVEFITVRDDVWIDKSFSAYDAVYHVAGVVHKKENDENIDLYYKVNRDLTYQIAVKAKNEGVESFVFLSTMAVYGLIGKIGEDTIISKETKATPTTHYGKSKLEAEELLVTLQSLEFNVSILRIPMIYGPNCPGNYRSLSKLARKTPVFPKVDNRRSMIFVSYLSDIIIQIMENDIFGLFLVKNPQNVNTLEMVNEIAKYHKKSIYHSAFLGILVTKFGNYFGVTKKMFSTVIYSDDSCDIRNLERMNLDFKLSIVKTENPDNK